MIKIVFTNNGAHLSDNQVEGYVEKVAKNNIDHGGETTCYISNELILLCFLLYVKEKKIDPDDIVIFMEGNDEPYIPSKNGRLKGRNVFPSIQDDLLNRMLGF